jgi:hypothetical protein
MSDLLDDVIRERVRLRIEGAFHTEVDDTGGGGEAAQGVKRIRPAPNVPSGAMREVEGAAEKLAIPSDAAKAELVEH